METFNRLEASVEKESEEMAEAYVKEEEPILATVRLENLVALVTILAARRLNTRQSRKPTMNKKNSIVLGVVLTLSTVLVFAQEKETKEKSSVAAGPRMFAAAEMQWGEGPPSLPAGAQMVVLDGDPRQKGSFTLRLKMPAGYKIPPHTHPAAERVTVIAGAVRLGIGEKFDENAGRELKAGDFAVIPAGVPHFAWSPAEAILQIHSEGPFQRKFIESKN